MKVTYKSGRLLSQIVVVFMKYSLFEICAAANRELCSSSCETVVQAA